MKTSQNEYQGSVFSRQDHYNIEAQVKAFADAEREKLGITEKPKQWFDPAPGEFTKSQRAHTTLLFNNITIMHDKLVEAGLTSLGYNMRVLDEPDNEALRLGKEFGNRGQCNPTHYLSGNLIKYLEHLHHDKGLSKQEIVDSHILMTAGACGPCRFGMYKTENRKSLRDSGYEGFRIVFFQNALNLKQGTEEAGLSLTPKFFITIIKSLLAGDVINAMAYRIRPYEVVAGSTNKAIAACKEIMCHALRNKKSILVALYKCRQVLNKVTVNRLQPKPKVSIIGEFWAMTTEGDGNYHLQKFLESEGAEVDVQMVTAWIMYKIWEFEYDLRQRMLLRRSQPDLQPLVKNPMKSLIMIKLAKKIMTFSFGVFARAIGLSGYHLPDMEENARLSHEYYSNELRGGEGHMEVGKLIQIYKHKKANLVISVKPFGCMPSSGVSDGIQSKVTARYPEANFLPIETSGDGAVNVYSRIQMALFRAKASAKEEFETAIKKSPNSETTLFDQGKKRFSTGTAYPAHVVSSTAANAIYSLPG